MVGGGSLPGETLPTHVLSLDVRSSQSTLRWLRQEEPPIVARTERGKVLLDPRTVHPEQDGALLLGLEHALRGSG